jgi:AcrR family transcriptional regulator
MGIRATKSSVRARQERAHELARSEILDAAGEVFARRGYAAATLADLARAAGYAPPSLYRYFESKEAIFRSLVARLKAELLATFEAPVDRSAPLPARLARLLGAQLELVRSRRDAFTLLTSVPPEALAAGAGVDGLHEGHRLFEAHMAGWLRRHVARRELRFPHEQAARALFGIAQAFHHHLMSTPGAPAEPGLVDLIVDVALNGIHAKPGNGRAPAPEESHR